MREYYLYFETLLCVLFYMLIVSPITSLFGTAFRYLRLFHTTCEFYSKNGIHFWQARKAAKIYSKQKADEIKEKLKNAQISKGINRYDRD